MVKRGLKEAWPHIGETLNDLWILAKLCFALRNRRFRELAGARQPAIKVQFLVFFKYPLL